MCVFEGGQRGLFRLLGQPGGIALNSRIVPENISYVFLRMFSHRLRNR
jgi:hypothetical protein